MNKWKKYRLKDLCVINKESIKNEHVFKQIEYVDISSVGTGILFGSTIMNIENAPSRAKRIVKKGDTILSTVRPNRRSFYFFKEANPNLVVSTGFAVLTPKQNVNNKFLYYLINDKNLSEYFANSAKGSAYPAIDTEIVENAEVKAPDIDSQTKITSILSAYDDLIENNLRRIQILEEMAQSIYKEWFVKFRFPGYENAKFVDSAMGKIPEGWEVGSIGCLYKVKSGFAFKSKDFRSVGENPVIKIKNIQNKFIDLKSCEYINKENSFSVKDYILKEGDLLIAMTGAQVGKIGIMPYDNRNCYLNQRVGKFFPKFDFLRNNMFIYFFAISDEFRNRIDNIAAGAAQPNISGSGIESISILIPTINLLKLFTEAMQNYIDQILILQRSNNNLSSTRDLLLPKLMSGEVEV